MSNNKDTLTGRRPAETYPGLLKLGSTYMTSSGAVAGDADISNIRLDSNARALQDGDGNSSPIWISATKLWLHGFEFTQPSATNQVPKYEVIGSGASQTKRLVWVDKSKLIDTSELSDPLNRFYSEANFDRSFSTKTTDDLTDAGATRKYFTNALARAAVSSSGGKLTYDKSTGQFTLGKLYTEDVQESINLYWTQARFNSAFAAKSTTDLQEGTKLYFTDARARAAISVTGGGATYNSSTGVISVPSVSSGASNLSGGAAQQIPYQLSATTTGFSARLKWDNTNRKLQLGDSAGNTQITGYGGTASRNMFTISSGDSVFGSDFVIEAGDTTGTNQAGTLEMAAGSSQGGIGGSLILTSGTGATGGSIRMVTGNTTLTESMRILPSGAVSFGETGTATGTTNQYLASSGSNSSPVWKNLPTRVAEAATADHLKGGSAGLIPYQTAASKTSFTDLVWSPGVLNFNSAGATISSKELLTIAPSTGLVVAPTGTATGTNIDIKVSAPSSRVSLSGSSSQVVGASSDGKLLVNGAAGTVNQVPMVHSDGITKYKVLSTTEVTEGTRLFWTQARFNTAFAGKNTNDLAEGTTNKYWSAALFDDALAGKTTTDLAEGTRLYWTQTRFNAAFTAKSTNDLKEGTTNKYWSPTLFDNALAGKTTTDIAEGTNLYWTQNRFNSALTAKSTTDVKEGNNLYFTNARARAAIGVSGALSYNPSTGVMSYDLPSAVDGEILYADGNNTKRFKPGPLVTTGMFVTSDEDLNFAKNQVTPQSQIISRWKAFSHQGANQPANPAELTAWEYVAASNSIRNTTNSGTFIGLVSDKNYKDYVHEVRLRSESQDDDIIGIVLAYVVENGVEYTLVANRSCGGFGHPWTIAYCYNTSMSWIIHTGATSIKWSNGSYGANASAAGYTGTPGWAPLTTGTKVKATRTGNTITVITTDINTEDYVQASEFTINLESDPRLSKFMVGAAIGFCAHSQQFSYWDQLQFIDKTPIYDMRNGQKWIQNGTSWVVDSGSSLTSSVGTGRILSDKVSGSSYYIVDSSTIIPMGKPPKPSDSIPDVTQVHQASITLAANASSVLKWDSFMGANSVLFDKSSVKPEVYILETAGPSANYYVSAIATANYGMNMAGDVVVHNPTSTQRSYLVRIYARKL